MKLIRILLLAGAIAESAFGWGCEGHQIVALIAESHLTAQARTAVSRLLQDYPIAPSVGRYCQPVAADAMADASTWADDIKRSAKNDAWHYIDIPREVRSGDVMRYCQPNGDSPGCVITAVEREIAILKDGNRSAADRATALRYVIHLIGDLHQPLHTSDDVGGNCISVLVFDNPKAGNLHAAWDFGLIAHWLTQNGQTPAEMAAQLDTRYAAFRDEWLHKSVDITRWVWESHGPVQKVVYGDLVPQPSTAPAEGFGPTCDAERAKTAALHMHIDAKYAAAAMPVIERQLAEAGYRLANVLNSVL